MTTSADMLATLAAGAGLYPMALDLAHKALQFVPMSEAGYRAASFLDARAGAGSGEWIDLSQVVTALSGARPVRPLHFIFHSGHVGSTLLSRLLDDIGGVLSLREPLPLRTLAEAHDGGTAIADTLEIMLRLWERGFETTGTVVLKATSSAARMGDALLAMRPDSRAVILNVSAESYLATIFAAPNSAADLNAHGPERLFRLRAMGLALPQPRTLPTLAAMSWLAESLTQERLQQTCGDRVLRIDFDGMLLSLESTLRDVVTHFAIACTPERIGSLAHSPILARYSKDPSFDYSPRMRAQRLEEARARYRREMGEGLNWLAEARGRLADSLA